ncbi:3-hydroxy-3-methylglutaryl-coenzyme A reductase-like [Oratosquilla oratoria]|uniref:3-hydroxy-3-methylglutaryl-coenzyme A reductase-like n=1 Tax=Oratosquilla oratoria TaxID=337810 RepID=UPI003F760DEB
MPSSSFSCWWTSAKPPCWPRSPCRPPCMQHEVAFNIALGMARLGPSLTLDMMVETLVIGTGTLLGVSQLEQMSGFACLSVVVVVNYLVLVTFYPACLSLVLKLSNRCSLSGQPPWQMADSLARALVDPTRSPAPWYSVSR